MSNPYGSGEPLVTITVELLQRLLKCLLHQVQSRPQHFRRRGIASRLPFPLDTLLPK